MIFYRSPTDDPPRRGPSIRQMRLYTSVALVAFPASTLVRSLDSDGPAWSFGAWFGVAIAVAGLALMLLSFWMAFIVWRSPLQRIVAEQETRLDEMEIRLRQRALSWSYGTIGALVLLLIVYAALASDFGLWLPDDYEEWNGLFWCAFLYIATLPTAFLAWTMDGAAYDEED